ncbi:MAG: hypothetical protein EPN65_16550 [Pandoraea sp.]|uniref:hypothetical protein n=1 Tax=Pandoraea sp. TaxID=1883445 RepID=UPI00122188E5|nr:hypothetical protein [Pandoraea sp.]TAM15924.1 MAG: hypothetical protein EPN65_16550 [Pandoraea sp.]
MTRSLADALPDEIARVTEVLGHYIEIGPAGMFGAAIIRLALDKATRALASGDVVEMISAYRELQEIES